MPAEGQHTQQDFEVGGERLSGHEARAKMLQRALHRLGAIGAIEDGVVSEPTHMEEDRDHEIDYVAAPSALPGEIQIAAAWDVARGNDNIVALVDAARHLRHQLQVASPVTLHDEDAIAGLRLG